MKDKKSILVIVVFLLIVAGIFGVYIQNNINVFLRPESSNILVINESWLPLDTSSSFLNFYPLEHEVSENGFIGLGFWSGHNVLDHSIDPVRIEMPQDRLNININNENFEDVNVIVKVFYNYQEAYFRLANTEDYMTEFVFTMPGGYVVDLPIYLDSTFEKSDSLSKLTVAIFPAPERFVMQDHEDLFFDPQHNVGLALDFELNYGSDSPLVLSLQESNYVDDIYNLWASFMVNIDSGPLTGGDTKLPPRLLQVKPTEEVELFFVADLSKSEMRSVSLSGEIESSTEITDYLIISMLDWQQIPMNGDPYLWITARENDRDGGIYGQHGRFFITAPEEPGFYEFVAFLVHNPTSGFSWDTFVPLEIAMRFTIEVVE